MQYSDIEIWHVYFCPQCRHAIPDPKDKYIIIVAKDSGTIFGCFINSNRTPYVNNRPYLHSCEANIPQVTHSFLIYNSIVDCHTVYSFTANEFSKQLGQIEVATKNTLLQSIYACPVIKTKRKKLIYLQASLTYPSSN
jgi:hypothetical protein